MARVDPESLRKEQLRRLEALRQLRVTSPERAKKESHERLVSAGLFQQDGRPTPLYS